MKICMYSPYVPKHFGGGEKHFFDAALVLAQKHTVFVMISGKTQDVTQVEVAKIKQNYEQFLHQDLTPLNFIAGPLGTNVPGWQKVIWTKQWDRLYYVTDGSLFFSLAKKNILHVQFPLASVRLGLVGRLKSIFWQVKNTNSLFTKKIIEPTWPIKIDYVHYPAVSLPDLPNSKKQKVILHVGRFFKQLHSKRQDVLVKIFTQLRKKYPEEFSQWKLVLIGSKEDESYAAAVAKLAQGLPVEIYHDLDRQEVLKWYAKASIYWHATGYGIDELEQPEKVEHFGISTVEAMLAGCVPVVINKGGQKEILTGKLQTLGWESAEDCERITIDLIQNDQLKEEYVQLAKKRAEFFSAKLFEDTLWQMM